MWLHSHLLILFFLMLTSKIGHIYFVHVPVFQVDGNQLVWACLMDVFL